MTPTLRRLDLDFAAPVPRGHEVAWARLTHPDNKPGEILIDTTSGIVYCEDALRGLFLFATAATEPLRSAAQLRWQIGEQVAGRVAGATVSSVITGMARSTAIRTALFVDTAPAPPPYR